MELSNSPNEEKRRVIHSSREIDDLEDLEVLEVKKSWKPRKPRFISSFSKTNFRDLGVFRRPKSLPFRQYAPKWEAITMNKLLSYLQLLHVLLPIWLTDPGSIKHGVNLPPTAYIDGLRGVASMLVILHHYAKLFIRDWHLGYGQGGEEKNHYNILQLPFLRLLINGRSSVAIFFVISGYVISLSSLKYMRSNRDSELIRTLSSSTFRRASRLFVPMLTIMCINGTLAYWGIYNFDGRMRFVPIPEATPEFRESYLLQMRDTFRSFTNATNPFNHEIIYPEFQPHCWTIPVEFNSSVIVFLMLLGLSRVRPWVRMSTVMLVANIAYLQYDNSPVFLFLSGTFLAEVSLIVGDYKQRKPWHIACLWISFVASLHILAIPYNHSEATPAYVWLGKFLVYFKLTSAYAMNYGAVLLLLTLMLSPPHLLQRPFTTWVAQYLGKISFSIYLIHGIIINSLGYYMFPRLLKTFEVDIRKGGQYLYVDQNPSNGYHFTVWSVLLNILFVTVFLADVFWRYVDMKSVNLAKWIENKCLKENLQPTVPVEHVQYNVLEKEDINTRERVE